jgi:phage baseplate assembly protein W
MATVTTNIVAAYSDLDLNFTIHPVRKDINRYTNEAAVVNSIKNLILTNHYEKPFQPEIGSNVRRLLFENMDTITATTLEKEIEQTIKNYEPRANISRLNVSPDYDNNGFKVYMEFYVVNRTSPITINFFLERIR